MATRKAKAPTINAECLADALEDALSVTNSLLISLVEMMSCPDCHGSGERPTRDPKISTRCDCRLSAESLLAELSDGEHGPGDDDDDTEDDDDDPPEGI